MQQKKTRPINLIISTSQNDTKKDPVIILNQIFQLVNEFNVILSAP
jgi:hypothetical protein